MENQVNYMNTNTPVKKAIIERWDMLSTDYDSSHGHGIQSVEEHTAWATLFSSILTDKKLNILEVGCGTGEMSFLLAELGHTVSGIDLSDNMLSRATEKVQIKKLPVEFTKGDAESPDFPDETFDVVINRHLLWTLPHPNQAIQQWMRVIKPGGKILIIDGDWRSGALSARIKRFIITHWYKLVHGKDAYESLYDSHVEQSLPHPYGMPHQEVMNLCLYAGLKPVSFRPLNDIARIIFPNMNLFERLSAPYDVFRDFYVVIAEKPNMPDRPD